MDDRTQCPMCRSILPAYLEDEEIWLTVTDKRMNEIWSFVNKIQTNIDVNRPYYRTAKFKYL